MQLFEKQRKTVKFLRKSNNANRLLRDEQNRLHALEPDPFLAHYISLGWTKVYPKKPVRPVIAGKTRWWSNLKQNKRFVRLKPALEHVLDELIANEDIPLEKRLNFEFSPSDWSVMTFCIDLMAPFKTAIKELEGEKYPTLPLVLKHLYSIRDYIANRRAIINNNSAWHARVVGLVEFLRRGIDDVIAELPEEAYIASLLDPRYLDAYIPQPLRARYWGRLDELVEERRILRAAQAPPPPPPQEPQDIQPPPRAGTRANPTPPVQKRSYDEIMKAKLTQKAGLLAEQKPYRELSIIGEKNHVGMWWKTNESVYPDHAALARRYLAIPATSAPSERVFSVGGRVLEKRRASLKPKTARAVMLVHENIDLLDSVVFDEELYDQI